MAGRPGHPGLYTTRRGEATTSAPGCYLAMDRVLGRVLHGVGATLAFSLYVLRRFWKDGCLTGAGALSYTTLVSLVPLIAIALATFSAFPIFENARDELLEIVFNSLVPDVGEEVRNWLAYFASSAAHTTAIGVLFLALTAILLLATIEDQLDAIWKVTSTRPVIQRVLDYWTLLTLGPLLVGASLSLSGYFDQAAQGAGFDPRRIAQLKEAWWYSASNLVPPVLEAAALMLLYKLVPNTAVRWREAAVGAIVAVVSIELLKSGFSYYIQTWSSYRTIYGALATIPIFLLWMYISWGAVLLGALVAAALPQWRAEEHAAPQPLEGKSLGLSLALLAALSELARQSGGTRRAPELAESLGAPASAIEDQLCVLSESGFVAHTTDGGWVLARDLSAATVLDLYETLGLPLAIRWREGENAPWEERISPAIRRLARAEQGAMRIPLARLLEGGEGPRLVTTERNAPR
jgi:membrane protein